MANEITAAQIGSVIGDYYYVYTQKGGFGDNAVRNIAQLTALYTLASYLDESVRSPILNVLSSSIRQQSE